MNAQELKVEIKALLAANVELEKVLSEAGLSLLHNTRIGLQLEQNKKDIKAYRKELKELNRTQP